MPYYSKRDGSLEWIENNDTFMNWWYGFIKKEVKKHRDGYGNMPTVEVGVNEGKLLEDGTGRVVSPKFVEFLHSEGYKYSSEQRWFAREWTCWTPVRLESIQETYKYDIDDKIWTYRIVKTRLLPVNGGGGRPGPKNPHLIWVEEVGSKE